MAAKAKTVYFWDGGKAVRGTVKNTSGSMSCVTLPNGLRKNVLTRLLGKTESEARDNYLSSQSGDGGK